MCACEIQPVVERISNGKQGAQDKDALTPYYLGMHGALVIAYSAGTLGPLV